MKNLAIKLKKRFTAAERTSLTTSDRDSTGRTSERMSAANNRSSGLKSSTSGDHDRSSAHHQNSHNHTVDGVAANATDSELDEISGLKRSYRKEDLLEPIASFREVSPDKRRNLFIKKLRLCSVQFDFLSESASENLGKEMKRQILLELVDHITTNKGWFSERILAEILCMVSSNIFRALGPSQSGCESGEGGGSGGGGGGYDGDEDEPALDPAWAHLQIVYEFLLRFIVSTEPDGKMMKRQLNGAFIASLLRIFSSEDPREREYLKTILHRIYGKFMSLRSFIRKSINHAFYGVIYEGERHNGIGELLEILGSIINGFALPLKVEHKKFLRNVLIPLHKVPRLQSFHQQLSYCITQFIDKDQSLSLVIMGGLLKFWPLVSSSKEVLFLNELEEIIETTPVTQLRLFLAPIFGRLSRCINNQHFQVAERALFFWNNDLIGNLTADHKEVVFAIIAPSLHRIKEIHWNTTVHSLSLNVTRMLLEIDADLYTQIVNEYTAAHSAAPLSKQEQRQQKWMRIEQIAQDNNSNSRRIP